MGGLGVDKREVKLVRLDPELSARERVYVRSKQTICGSHLILTKDRSRVDDKVGCQLAIIVIRTDISQTLTQCIPWCICTMTTQEYYMQGTTVGKRGRQLNRLVQTPNKIRFCPLEKENFDYTADFHSSQGQPEFQNIPLGDLFLLGLQLLHVPCNTDKTTSEPRPTLFSKPHDRVTGQLGRISQPRMCFRGHCKVSA